MTEPRLRDCLGPRYWPTWLGLGFLRLIAFLPLPLVWVAGSLTGELLYWLHAPRRRIVHRNLAACFPERSVRARRGLARAHFRAMMAAVFAMPVAWWGSPRRLARLVTRRGEEHLCAAERAKQPVILLAPHFIALDHGGIAMSKDHRVVTMYKRPKNRLMDVMVRRSRARFGVTVVARDEGIKPVLRAMKQGASFYYLPDQDQGARGAVFAPFFGVPAATLTAPSRIAEMTGAIVIPCVTRQRPWGRGFEVTFGAPVAGFPSGDALRDAALLNRVIEDAARAMPEQYFWVHKRFKTRPEGEKAFY